jgi:DNA mismatch repair protein MutS
MEYTKEILVSNYFDIHNFYSNIYGANKTIIVMQVGSFHECYCTDEDGLNLMELAQKLDVICTRKNSKEPVSSKNPRMMGFPIFVTDNFIEKLCNFNFTVIKIDQTSDPPKPKREVVGIFSPATLIDKQINSNNSNFIVSIVLDKIKNNYLCIGISAYDLSTGHGSFFETYSTNNDPMLALDDTIRYLETCPPKEILLYNLLDENINNMNIDDILIYLNLNEKLLFNINNKNISKVAFQKNIFDKVFPNEKNIFDNINLHLYNWARMSLTNLYLYTQQHQYNLINKLKLPVEFKNKQFLYLGNHALDQLNIINKNINEKSLFQIINQTKTILGKRFLYESITKPLINKEDIEKRYDLIEKIINNNLSDPLIKFLEDISDLDRLLRRIELGIMNPNELYILYLSIYQINKLHNFCNENNIFDIEILNSVDPLINYINETFNIQLINNLNFNNFTEYDNNIFIKNKYEDIDNLLEEINSSTNFMNNLVETLSKYIDDKKIFVKDGVDNNMITMKFNERDGHYLYITIRRCDILKKKLENIKELEIGKHKLKISDLEFIEMPKSSYTKINCTKIKEISNELVVQKNKMAKLIKEKFKLELIYISDNFNKIISYWGKKIGFMDFINSGAITAIKQHYIKPIIKFTNGSYFNSIKMRHPIIEYISKDYEYKPHSLSLGGENELTGILLYGINSSGKSTLMKSIGLNIILAQIGYFVAAEEFIFSPYNSLFTRINCNDNIYKGLSSFMVEMIELTSILKRNDSNTLVLGDEICKGTENKSANIIVSYMLKTLSESRSTFITATHLHELVNLPTVKELNNVKARHLKITYDEINEKLIYDRELSDGPGESFYGLQVAKYLMRDKTFNEITNNILNEYNNTDFKQSKYNSNNYLIECEICKSKELLETHHIIFQKDFNDKEIIKNNLHYQKDANYNLVTLCRSCHDEVDRNKIIINYWKETSNGRELDYYINNDQIVKNKYSDELINYIKFLQNEVGDAKMARIKIKEKYDKKISKESILRFWN